MMGITPARRAALPSTYTGLTLKNGVPIGYVQVELLGCHGALSFNTFETFRLSPRLRGFLRAFSAAARYLFGCTVFSVEPYQLGQGNEEGIESGAWWFYQRLGFRPSTAAARRIAAREIARRAAKPRYRSSAATLRALARSHMFLVLDRSRPARLPRIDLACSCHPGITSLPSSRRREAPRGCGRRGTGAPRQAASNPTRREFALHARTLVRPGTRVDASRVMEFA